MAKTTETDNSGFEQSATEKQTGTKNSVGGSTVVGTNRTDKALTSKSTDKTEKGGTSEQIQESRRVVGSKTVSENTSTERANIGFTISFSIPLMGIVPGGKSNC